jgi:hypothetical protein
VSAICFDYGSVHTTKVWFYPTDVKLETICMETSKSVVDGPLDKSYINISAMTWIIAIKNSPDGNCHTSAICTERALAEITELNSIIAAANEEMTKLKEELQNREGK